MPLSIGDSSSYVRNTFCESKSQFAHDIFGHGSGSSTQVDRKYYRSVICSPILPTHSETDDAPKPVGVVCVSSSKKGHFNEETQEVFISKNRLLAGLLTASIERSKIII